MADTIDLESFLVNVADDRRAAIRTLHELITTSAPSLTPYVHGAETAKPLLGYGSYHYRYASGREGDWFVLGLANQKQYISLYACLADEHGYLAESRKDRLGKVSVGRSCIRFKRIDDLNLDEVRQLAIDAAAMVANGVGFSM